MIAEDDDRLLESNQIGWPRVELEGLKLISIFDADMTSRVRSYEQWIHVLEGVDLFDETHGDQRILVESSNSIVVDW